MGVKEEEKSSYNEVQTINDILNVLAYQKQSLSANTDNTSIIDTIKKINTFVDREVGAQICEDIGNRTYDAIYTSVLNHFNKTSFNDFKEEEMQEFLGYLKEQLSNEAQFYDGYRIIDFAMNGIGFQGGIYENIKTGECVVVCRGTEFSSEFYSDFIKTDVMHFGLGRIPDDFFEMEKLVDRAIALAGRDKVHIVGHSLAGGVAQMLGALEKYQDIDVTTYNAVGVEHLLNNLIGQGYALQYKAEEAKNIMNYATCNDFVSTIFNLIGSAADDFYGSDNKIKRRICVVEPKTKKQVLNNAASVVVKEGLDVDEDTTIKIIDSIEYASNGHGIDNFIGFNDSSIDVFEPFVRCNDLKVYKTLTDFLKLIKGDFLTIYGLAPLITLVSAIVMAPSQVTKTTIKIFKSRKPIGYKLSANSINNSDDVLVGGISMLDTPEQYDYICQALVDDNISFVGKIIDKDDNIGFYISDAANANSAINDITKNSKYFEIYNNGQELIYNQNFDEIYIYQNNASPEYIKAQINAWQDLHIAIVNQQDNGDSMIIGDNSSNALEGNAGDNIIYGGNGNDVLTGSWGNDTLNGGGGFDRYSFSSGDGNDIIDAQESIITSIKDIVYKTKQGCVEVDSRILTGGNYNEQTGMYESSDIGVDYDWSGMNGTDLKVNYGSGDSITIKNFKNGDLGILFDRSETDDPEDVEDQLKREKQVQADLAASNDKYEFKDTKLVLTDNLGQKHEIINCEKTGRLLNAYDTPLSGAQPDTNKTFMLLDPDANKITVQQKPVDYSPLISEMKDFINGKEVKRNDLPIQNNIYIPKSSLDGSPVLQDVYYQYTTKPSNGALLPNLFTAIQFVACLITQQWWSAVFLALDTGIAGKASSDIASIVDTVVMGYKFIGNTEAGNKAISAIIGGIKKDNRLAYLETPDMFKANLNYDDMAIDVQFPPLKDLLESSSSYHPPIDVPKINIFDGFRAGTLVVNQLPIGENKIGNLYQVSPDSGSISGSLAQFDNLSKLVDPDVSTPDDTERFKLGVEDRGCPLILDLDGDGIETLDIDETDIYFNTQNTEFSTKTGWVSGDEGILAVDKDGDGKITRQDELFGNQETSGFEMLKNYDSNNDGVIDSRDTKFNELKVWQDANENGITDEGELKSLTERGITSINLNSVELNQEQNQNTITGMSSYTTSDGKVHHIYNVNLAFNKIYTKYTGNYELSIDVLDMPWLRGYGQVKDLQLKMSEDETFKQYVKELANLDDAKQIYDKMDEFLAKWIGCENIEANAATNGINDRQIAVLDKYLNLGLSGTITADKKAFMDSAYISLKNKIYANFIAQTALGNAFEINYDYKTDSMLYNDNTYQNLVTNLTNQKNFYASYIIAKVLNDAEALDGNKLAYTITEKGYGASLISYLNSGFQILDSGEMKILDPNAPMYVIGTSGNDVITGTDNADIIYGMDGDDILNGGAGDDYLSGGNGNDILIGGDGNDTLDGGAGDDNLQGGYGDDTYIYDGQGKDVIIDERWVKIARQEWYLSGWWIFKKWKSRWIYQDQLVDAGNDTVIFGDDVKEKDVTISKSGDDLIFELKGTDDKLTIKNWYKTKEQRVENFVFADGFIIKAEQIINSITDTTGADSLNGTDDDNFIVSAAGNDIIEAKKGNDAIINHEGNTTYKFNLGDGHDIIMDYQGTDKILFGPSINQEDVVYCRNDKDLVISIKNMSDSITILNWFLNDDYKIESIEFSNGVIITPDDVHNLLSTTIATGYDDVIIGNDEDNTIDGLSGNDYIEGRGGNDTIIGGLGKDIMKGGAGDDIYYIDNAGDQVIENENEGNDTIRSNVSYILPDNVENLELIGSGAIDGKGNELNNTIAGNDNNNILDGSSGINTLKGGKGDDTYIINETNANDVIIENKDEGNDTVKSSISYTLNAENVENLVLTGEANVNGTGNSMDNYIEGNKGNNILNGGAGNDKLYGNGGSDTLMGGTGDDTYIIDTTDAVIVENANEGIDTVITNINYTLGANIENLVLAGKEGITGTGNAANNIITGNDSNNTFIGGKGNDTLAGGAGADTYVFNLGDGQDIIQENSPDSNAIDKIIFGAGITKNNTKFTKTGYDLIITINGTSDKITIKNSNLAFGSRIERFEFSDGSFIDGKELYKLFAETSKPNLYSDVSYLDISSKSSSMDREYYEEGELKSETIYNDQGNIVSKTVYSTKGYVIEEYTYNSDGQILKEVAYEDNYATVRQIKTQKEYTYSNGKLSQVKNYNIQVLNSTEKYTYGSNGLVSRITIYQKDTSTVKNTIDFTYDSARRLSTKTTYKKNTTDIEEKITYTYNSAGHITRELTQEGYYRQIKSGTTTKSVWDIRDAKIVNCTYDGAGNITRKVVQVGYDKKTVSGATTTFTWTLRDDEIVTYTYNASGKLTKEYVQTSYSEQVKSGTSTRTEWKLHDGKVVDYTYNSKGEITKIVTRVGYNKVIPTSLPNTKFEWVLRNDEIVEYEYTSDGKPLRQTTTKAYSEMVNYLGHTYSDYRNMHKTNEILYVYNDLGNIQSVTEMMGCNEMVFWGGAKQQWTQVIKNKTEYTYNSNYQLSQVLKYEQYSEPTQTKYNGVNYSYSVYKSRESEKTVYTYNADCRVTNEKIYKYKTVNSAWSPYLYEEIKYTYDSEGRLYLAEHFKDGKPSEAFKYEYVFDDDGYLVKQNIYKGVISNNQIASYNKIQEVTVNSYYNSLNGDGSNNTLNGSNQSDELFGGAGNDVLYGNGGNDYLDGGAGADLMIGGKGDDTYVIDSTKDIIVEHANQGIDTVQTHLDYTLSANLENLVLTGTGNTIGKGNSVDNIIQGNSGNNVLYGYAGNDIIDGGAGNDTIYGGDHNDIISGGAGNDTLYGESGDDTYYFKTNDGIDNILDSSGKKDRVLFDADVDKNKIAFYQDGNNLIIDYGENSGADVITITNQANADNAIEKFELSDGTYITNYDVNQIIQNMTAYAQNNAIEFNGIDSVKNNSDLMNLIATSWHN